MKETVASILHIIGFKSKWVLRNAKLFYQNGKEVSWGQVKDKEKNFPYYFINGRDVFTKTCYNYEE